MFELSDIRMNRGGRSILTIDQLQIPTNKLTVILGHNGSGKSTLVSLLAGQQPADSGKVYLNNQKLNQLTSKNLAREVAFLPQKLPASAGLSVKELVRLGRFPWRGTFGRWNKQDERIIADALQQTGMTPFTHTLADELSGGERQRAWVAMLLAQQAPVLILDEPTSALDIQHQYQLMALLEKLNQQQGCGIIVILHDLNLTLRYATHVVALNQGRIAFDGPTDILHDEQRLKELYRADIRLMDHPYSSLSHSPYKVAVVCE